MKLQFVPSMALALILLIGLVSTGSVSVGSAQATPLRELVTPGRSALMSDLGYLRSGIGDPGHGGNGAASGPSVNSSDGGVYRVNRHEAAQPDSNRSLLTLPNGPWESALAFDLTRVSSEAYPVASIPAAQGTGATPEIVRNAGGDRDKGQMSLEQFGRELARKGLLRRAAGSANAPGERSEDPIKTDFGLNLVQFILDSKIDRELARPLLSTAEQVRTLLAITRRQAKGLLGADASGRNSWDQENPEQFREKPVETTISDGELDRIRAEHEGAPIASFKDFLNELLIDPRIVMFFGLSVAFILLGLKLISRWGRV